MVNDTDFKLYKQVHPDLRVSGIWLVARVRPDCLSLMKLLACLCCQRPPDEHTLCRVCGQTCTVEIYHLMFNCNLNDNVVKLSSFLDKVNLLTELLCDFLGKVSSNRILLYILGKIDDDILSVLDIECYPDLLILCAEFFSTLMHD